MICQSKESRPKGPGFGLPLNWAVVSSTIKFEVLKVKVALAHCYFKCRNEQTSPKWLSINIVLATWQSWHVG